MKRMLSLLLLTGSGIITAQNKTVVSINGEKLLYNPYMTLEERNTKYVLPQNAPHVGFTIFNTTTNCHEFYDGNGWYNYCWGGRNNATSGGSANVTSYNCNTSSQGIMDKGTLIDVGDGVTQIVTIELDIEGTYNITAEAHGVLFKGSGTLPVGSHEITLIAEGTPTAAGMLDFTVNITPSCTFSRLITGNIGDGTVITGTGKIWDEKNLGATEVPTSIDDHRAYGSLYQWGRRSDGHEVVAWTSAIDGTLSRTTDVLSENNDPYPGGNGPFILPPNLPLDWRRIKNNDLWQGVSGDNNPCLPGFRLPTGAEFGAEFSAAGITDLDTAYRSILKLMPAGYRHMSDATLKDVGRYGHYWTSDTLNEFAQHATVTTPILGGAHVGTNNWRSFGCSVRCIKD